MSIRLIPALAVLLSYSPLIAQAQNPWPNLVPSTSQTPLPNSEILAETGEIARLLVEANDRFLDAEIMRAKAERDQYWQLDLSSPEAFVASIAPNRTRLADILGIHRETRATAEGEAYFVYRSLNPSSEPIKDGLSIHEVEWRAFGEVRGRGVLITPPGEIVADLIAVADADSDAHELPSWALRLAHSGCRVLMPRLVDRGLNEYNLSRREWVQRSAFVLGRTLAGYEVLKLQSGIDCLLSDWGETKRPLGIIGHGEGGRLALFTATLDLRIDAVAVSGAFGPRESLWQEPADHNLFGFLREFGDAELGGLIAPRPLVIEYGTDPSYTYRAGKILEIDTENRAALPGKPARLATPTAAEVAAEVARLRERFPIAKVDLVEGSEVGSDETLTRFLKGLGLASPLAPSPATIVAEIASHEHDEPSIDLTRHNQEALIAAAGDRKRYFSDLKTNSLKNFEESIETWREQFRTDVIGDFELPLLPPRARTRPYQESEHTLSYEVVLDVMESGGETVFTYGILTLPKDLDLSSGEKRPVVVCQHGLEGTPQGLIGELKYNVYESFATRLAERGFITFAPQNGYKYFDLFRLQQFKAQSIGKTLFSIIVPQHRQITDWLASQPWVDSDKIAFYGLSYGGKAAMRIPPLVERYALSICSGDFNEWVWKNAATDVDSLRYSYMNKGEYEIFEWNLGGTFNYAEMASLICPRPFMVERGHFDGVAPDEQVAYEFAKVQNLYEARLGLKDRCEIEWFKGPHKVNFVGTYEFLSRHLAWPPAAR